jgi:alpha/beta superfamily hydrolase
MRTLLIFWLLSSNWLFSQAPFTVKNYGYTLETNLVYGVATNYYGSKDSLKLDLYKPLLDGNKNRPLLVLVHGGGWLGGCKDDQLGGMVAIAKEMAQRGYVVASINYRLGWHHTTQDVGLLNPYKCNYPNDSCEVIRALFRATQDTKAAIRWLKGRATQDSTCTQAVLVGGDSAGGFNALAAAFLDRPEEKPDCAFELTPATPHWNGQAQCASYQCQILTVNPAGTQLLRPDLGSIRGDINLIPGIDDKVAGVLNFYGGVPDIALTDNWIQGADTPAVYMYHQTCDAIVPFGSNHVNYVLSSWCNLGNPPWHYKLPVIHGSGSLDGFFKTMTHPPQYVTDFMTCPNFNPDLALFECIRMQDNGSYHYISNPAERALRTANFFSPIISARLNSCTSTAIVPLEKELASIKIWPNPAQTEFTLWSENQTHTQIMLWNALGTQVATFPYEPNQFNNFNISHLPNGLYFGSLGSRSFKLHKISH